jgi:RNA polymerase sigma-70 factor (ECF subfamily)
MNEAQTIAQAQQGDLSAFNRLVMAHQGVAFSVAYRIMGDAEAAADVCQDAFLSAYRHIRGLRGASFKSWLLRIVTNACYDRLRYQRRRPVSSLEDITTGGDSDDDPDHSPWLIDNAAGPEEVTMNRQLAGLIQQGIASLPPDQRVIRLPGRTVVPEDRPAHSIGAGKQSPATQGQDRLQATLRRRYDPPRSPVVVVDTAPPFRAAVQVYIIGRGAGHPQADAFPSK